MEKEIEEIIKKNLPAHVGEVLRKRLEQADRDENTVKSQAEQIISKDASIRSLESKIAEYKACDERNSKLEARERDVTGKERDLKTAMLEYQLQAEKDKTKFSKDVALGLVRNIEYRSDTFHNKNTPVKDQYGNMQTVYHSDNSVETKKAQ